MTRQIVLQTAANDRGYSYSLALGAGYGFAGVSDGEFGAGGAPRAKASMLAER